MEEVILVDVNDHEIGRMEKLEAHRKGLLHRALSVFIFNSKHELLLQQRALHKYHSGGLWTNTCCSHPRAGEQVSDAANRRLKEEMGMQATLTCAGHFIYKTELEHGLIEHELDYVFFGNTNTDPIINKDEAAAFRWVSIPELKREIQESPQHFTYWFPIALNKFFNLY
jgi:isopentenyl-diphosphate delta-isomerase